jgi:hypothetical protein
VITDEGGTVFGLGAAHYSRTEAYDLAEKLHARLPLESEAPVVVEALLSHPTVLSLTPEDIWVQEDLEFDEEGNIANEDGSVKYLAVIWEDPSMACGFGLCIMGDTGDFVCSVDMVACQDGKCPLGDYPCIPIEGVEYCSPNSYICESLANPVNFPEISDTPQGINDKQDDGEIEDGVCLGTIYIFNGRDMRCRLPGTQTGFSNCCTHEERWFGMMQCNETEQETASLARQGLCHEVGEYCASKFFGICLQKKKTYCCFNSKLARIIAEQGRPQLKSFGPDGDWGDPKHPNCRGFTPEEFQKLDFSKIDFSEFYNDILNQTTEHFNNNFEQNIENTQEYIENFYK